VTVTVVDPLIVDPLIDPEVAVILALPTATLLASPCPFTVATLPLPALQVTALVRSSVLPSL
jgi:hypothetical protein